MTIYGLLQELAASGRHAADVSAGERLRAAVAARPPSAVSALTAGGLGVLLILTLVAVIRHWVPAYLLLLSAALAAMIVFNVWAARGSDPRRTRDRGRPR
jgi:hypothetical protein